MMDAIDFFEKVGQDARLRYATSGELEDALARAELDPAIQAAIVNDDARQLRALLGARTQLCCLIEKPEEGEEEDEDDEDEDGEDDGDDLKSRVAAPSRVSQAD
ncbi:MAG: hypothetical protein ACREUC_06155 [Steroidobacteraceae bacterium]